MTIRDLSDEQIYKLTTACQETFVFRDARWQNTAPDIIAIYREAFSDGVKAALELFTDTQPNAQTRPPRS